jgi:hypothetical protein
MLFSLFMDHKTFLSARAELFCGAGNLGGIYNDTLVSYAGCDSILTTDLQVIMPLTGQCQFQFVQDNRITQEECFRPKQEFTTILSCPP